MILAWTYAGAFFVGAVIALTPQFIRAIAKAFATNEPSEEDHLAVSEAEADAALYAEDPQLAVELGFVPPLPPHLHSAGKLTQKDIDLAEVDEELSTRAYYEAMLNSRSFDHQQLMNDAFGLSQLQRNQQQFQGSNISGLFGGLGNALGGLRRGYCTCTLAMMSGHTKCDCPIHKRKD